MKRLLVMLVAGLWVLSLFPALEEGSAFAGEMAQKRDHRKTHRDAGPNFGKSGELMRPEGYRNWIFVGAPVTPNDMNEGKAAFPEFHNVYIDRASFKAYKKTGKFRDGTIFVKELVSVGSKKAASGNGYFPGEFSGIAVAVKDSKHFPKEPGYWAYFNFGTDKKMAAAEPTASCNACHKANAAEDWVFTQYYPVLRAVKP